MGHPNPIGVGNGFQLHMKGIKRRLTFDGVVCMGSLCRTGMLFWKGMPGLPNIALMISLAITNSAHY